MEHQREDEEALIECSWAENAHTPLTYHPIEHRELGMLAGDPLELDADIAALVPGTKDEKECLS